MAKPISLPNGRSWKTQGEALSHFKEMLARYADNDVIADRSDHDDLIALLERFDGVEFDQPSKIGVGVSEFIRKRNVFDGFSTPSFWVRRVDDSETDFSYIWAVKGEPKSNAQEFYDACRATVNADLVAAKRNHFKIYGDATGRVPCELTGELIQIDQAHIDHAYPTFGHLVVAFRAVRGWQRDIPLGVLSAPADCQATTSFVDPAVSLSFADFHHSVALLRIVSARANLSMAAGQRRPKVKQPVTILC